MSQKQIALRDKMLEKQTNNGLLCFSIEVNEGISTEHHIKLGADRQLAFQQIVSHKPDLVADGGHHANELFLRIFAFQS